MVMVRVNVMVRVGLHPLGEGAGVNESVDGVRVGVGEGVGRCG